jgi:hypothetical protein
MIPTQTAGQPAPAPQEGTICIAPLGDGTFMVYPEGTEPTGEPAQDIDAALELARTMLEGAGAPADQGGQSADAEAEALFTSEFNKTNGRTPMEG